MHLPDLALGIDALREIVKDKERALDDIKKRLDNAKSEQKKIEANLTVLEKNYPPKIESIRREISRYSLDLSSP